MGFSKHRLVNNATDNGKGVQTRADLKERVGFDASSSLFRDDGVVFQFLGCSGAKHLRKPKRSTSSFI